MDIKRRYREVVDLGSGPGVLVRDLEEYEGLEKVIMTDASEPMLWRDPNIIDNPSINIQRILTDEESLNLSPNTHECIMSCLSLHWVNDLPGTLVQIKDALKPDGVFIGAMFGGDTLFELRYITALQLAEQERQGGISARVSPMTDCRSMSSLINRAGFAIPTVDIDEVTVHYPSMFELIDDLRWMGESNAIVNRRSFLRRDTLLAAASIYEALYGKTDKEKGTTVPATFQVIYFIGWKPDASQPKPLERGSAERSLKELGTGSTL
ncbi:S-adenosyl-L-methionine-dependent methyltransferase [Melampsora americana]|nr:S-adenosyl-L-methionine-dependent methyltransferase [Melampsora americana]